VTYILSRFHSRLYLCPSLHAPLILMLYVMYVLLHDVSHIALLPTSLARTLAYFFPHALDQVTRCLPVIPYMGRALPNYKSIRVRDKITAFICTLFLRCLWGWWNARMS
jgi:hypothetical protein